MAAEGRRPGGADEPSPVAEPTAEGPPARLLGRHAPAFLSRVEDAGLNASAPSEQRWIDGWLVRFNPGKAQRARCINAVAPGRRPVAQKLEECRALYAERRLPLIVRITPFTVPGDFDEALRSAGFGYHDDTRVMVLPDLAAALSAIRPAIEPPAGLRWQEVDAPAYAEAVGAIRGSPPAVRRAHAERLQASPVRYRGFLLTRAGELLACGQVAQEGDLVGLYDIATFPGEQRRGYGEWLCQRLLTLAQTESGARSAYLQVGADNDAARRLYTRLGFTDGYSYHYRMA